MSGVGVMIDCGACAKSLDKGQARLCSDEFIRRVAEKCE